MLAGRFGGKLAPAEVFTPLVGIDLESHGAARTELTLDPAFEHGVMALEGGARVDGESLAPGALLYLGPGRDRLVVDAPSATRLLLIGGVPFGEEILLWWNFVGRSYEEMEQATRDWVAGERFGRVEGARGEPLIAPDLAGLRLRGAS